MACFELGSRMSRKHDIEKYERQAAECERMAQNSKSDADRASWLRMGQEWLRLLRFARGNETPQVDQKDWPTPSSDTPDSDTSH